VRWEGGESDVDDLLGKLRLSEGEADGVFLAKEDRSKLPEVKWLVAAKLLTVKHFSEQLLIATMRSTWNTACEVSFRPMGKNLFLVQAFCLGDWQRIMEEGPWIFCGYALMLEKFDGATPMPSVLPHKVRAWVQIHKTPPLYRSKAILNHLAGRVGEVVTVELRAVSHGGGDFHQARVNLLASKPLPRVVTLAPE
jgi:hypothetical protein